MREGLWGVVALVWNRTSKGNVFSIGFRGFHIYCKEIFAVGSARTRKTGIISATLLGRPPIRRPAVSLHASLSPQRQKEGS